MSEAIGITVLKWLMDEYSKSLSKRTKRLDEARPEKLKNLMKWYKSQSLVFVLGAGVSKNYGLPDWNTLLQKMLLNTLTPAGEDAEKKKEAGVLAQAFSNIFDPDPLIAARYLHEYFKEANPKAELAFEGAIRKVLYEGVDKDSESDLLKEIRNFCIAAGRSPNLDSILTYNYDDLLESCLKNVDVDIPFKAIHARGMKPDQHELPIYHVHGYLPESGSLTTKNKVLLSEEGYHEQYSDSYSWSNLIQINKFKDCNCLFVGVSFSDPNLRRLLDIAKDERGEIGPNHYCFRRRYEKSKFRSDVERLLTSDMVNTDVDGLTDELIGLMERFEENYARSFGVGVIWVDSYDEIPGILKSVRAGTA